MQPFPRVQTDDRPDHQIDRRENGYNAIVERMRGRTRVTQIHDSTPDLAHSIVAECQLPEDFAQHFSRASVFRDGEPLARFDWPDPSYDREEFAGWPCLSMTSRLGVSGDFDHDTFEMIGHLTISAARSQSNWPETLPIKPVWPGFPINTALYACGLWLIILGPLRARSMIRTRRGLCAKCAYDLRGNPAADVCPECGYNTRHCN